MSTVLLTDCIASEAYKADPNVVAEGMQSISNIKGVIANYQGLGVNDGNALYTVQVVTSPEAIAEVFADKELYDKIDKQMSVGRVGTFNQCYFVAFSDPLEALVGPLTEISQWTLKDPTPENKKEVENFLAAINKESGGRFTYGWKGQDPNTVIVLAAWPSEEALRERASQPDVVEALAKYYGITHPKVPLAKLTKF